MAVFPRFYYFTPFQEESDKRRSIIPYAESSEPEREHIPDPKPSVVGSAGRKFLTVLKWFFIIIVALVVLGAASYFIYTNYINSKPKKRLY